LSKSASSRCGGRSARREPRTYLDQPDDAFALLVANPDIEIVAHSERPDPAYRPATMFLQPSAGGVAAQPARAPWRSRRPRRGCRTAELETKRCSHAARRDGPHRKTVAQARVQACRRGIRHLALRPQPEDCGYCFHEVIKREEDLIADGYDRDEIKAIPSYTMLTKPGGIGPRHGR